MPADTPEPPSAPRPAPAARPRAGLPEAADLGAAIRSLRRASVLVVGDASLDRYVYGRVERISNEAPVPVLSVEREVALPGGAGNIVRNLTALGAAVAFVSVVGDDQAGADLTGLVGGQPGVEPWLLVQGGRATPQKTRFIAQGHPLLRADHGPAGPIHPRLAERLVKIASDAVAATSVLVVADHGGGVLANDTPQRLLAAARAAGRFVLAAPRGRDLARHAGANLVVAARRDVERATGLPCRTDAEIAAAAESLRAGHRFGAVLVSRSEEGMTLLDRDGVLHLPAEAPEVHDVSGAADAVAATLAAALAAAVPLRTAARLASLAAGVVVAKVGPAVAREQDLLEALTPERGALRKIRPRSVAVEQAERWRRRGLRIGFLAGGFDLPGQAEIALIAAARAACDRLVVGLADDSALAAEAAGPRPLQAQAARAAVLASLPTVDLVTLFEAGGAASLARALRPDVLLCGEGCESAGLSAAMVAEWGGELRRLSAPPAEAALPG
ncbi:MAG: PfkB family carbohydrate kinase [Acetobacteraceae bacterium]|nr:PfkB family carbohydrate kinase [Acetobacteraceae bacterium]